MKVLFGLLAITMLLLVLGCAEKSEKLTEVNMNELKVPQNFNYDMSKMVEVNLAGSYRLPVTISSLDGKVLYRGIMLPGTGMKTKLRLANTNSKVMIAYHDQEVILSVNGNKITYNFNSK